MLDPWLAAGQDYALFWGLTPREVHVILNGYYKHLQQRTEMELQQSHYLANLIRVAFHNPDKMPKPPGSQTVQSQVARDEDHAKVSAYFRGLAMKGGS